MKIAIVALALVWGATAGPVSTKMTPAENKAFVQALKKTARCTTGRMIWIGGMAQPEMKKGCKY